ncbi:MULTISPECIES: hypothetical protein [unclassified Bradyrhizobium]|uniref:hypothetical protein n=1 Tax=unclassified Bradyrhizobium TaxID=2631580 RepID=UPI0028E55194|nr:MULTISPECIES: hypothetical protein [unclassified Bradyrhizobium]
MNVFDHGTWSRYQPDTMPDGFPAGLFVGAIFIRNDVSGVDWYDYLRGGSLDAVSVKAVCRQMSGGHWIVSVATVEQSRLLPDGCRVVELFDAIDFTDPNAPDPQSLFGGKMYDPSTNTLVDAPAPPVMIPDSVTKLGLKRSFDELGQWGTVKAAIAADPKTQEEWDLATSIKRTDPLVQGVIAVLNLTSDQVDQLIIRAHALTA